MIPFLDLKQVNARFHKPFEDAYREFLNSGNYILADQVARFETNFASYCGTKYCIGVANGLDALTLIFKSYIYLGKLKKGDEIIVPANTYVASILAIINSGLTPILVEPDCKTYTITASTIKKAIGKNTKGILVVHLYGQLVDMTSILNLSKSKNLIVIEDAAQAHGAKNAKAIKAGNLANAAAFSFYPTKNLGALGDAGAITTNDKALSSIVFKYRNYGSASKYNIDLIGVNSRLDEIQAMFLNIKLKMLDNDNLSRRNIAKMYLSHIKNDKIILPYFSHTADHVFHQFVIRVADRKGFIDYLKQNNVETGIHYPIPPHQQNGLLGYTKGNFVLTEHIHKTVVSLPIYPTMALHKVHKVIMYINAY